MKQVKIIEDTSLTSLQSRINKIIESEIDKMDLVDIKLALKHEIIIAVLIFEDR